MSQGALSSEVESDVVFTVLATSQVSVRSWCAFWNVDYELDCTHSAADAIAAARFLTSLEEPIAIVGEPRHGRAADLYPDNPAGGFTDQAARDFAARQARTAWRVDLTGRYAESGCDALVCPLVSATNLLLIDEETGALLFGDLGVGP